MACFEVPCGKCCIISYTYIENSLITKIMLVGTILKEVGKSNHENVCLNSEEDHFTAHL